MRAGCCLRKTWRLSLIGLAVAMSCAGAQAQVYRGNDTGGIIPWSPENERNAFAIAEQQCRWHNKFPVPSSIHRVYGDYIAYRCVWDKPRYNVRRYDPRRDEAIDMTVGTNGSGNGSPR
jgi:hypothetical protein